jgi:glucokinase
MQYCQTGQRVGKFTIMSSYVGIEIGGTKLQIVAGDQTGRIHDRRRLAVDRAAGAAGIQEQIMQGVRELQKLHSPSGIGVGFGGPVLYRDGRIARSHQIEGWSGFPLGEWLQSRAGLPVSVENDSNLATLAEASLGAGAGASPVFYFNLGSGVGGGIAIDGRIFHGCPPGEAEFGHLKLDPAGVIVEERCSGWAIDRRLRAMAIAHPDSPLARMLGATPGGEGVHFRAALEAGDAGAKTILQEIAADLGIALSHVVHLIHPEVVVLGGGLSAVGEPLRAAIAEALRSHLMEVFQPGPAIRLAKLGEDAVPIGALLLAGQDRRF